jgi:ATP-dependent exoDNAse (exonuclease V) alpha subunit
LPTKAEVESLNRYHINQLDSVGFTYPAKIILNKYPNSNPKLEAILPITDSLYLKKGALVMMVANDPGHRWVNGTLGIVSNLSKDGISVAINRQVYNIEPVDFREQEATYINGKITYEDILVVKQYPLVLAYAITIHKSQGQTYQNIVCDIDRCFTNGQAYVALSRCASLNGLHLKRRVTGSSIRVDRQVLDFYREQQNPDKLPF